MKQNINIITASTRNDNRYPSIVPLKSLLDDAAFRECEAALPVAVGRDAQGIPKIIDLARAPHILMAGATQQGKTTAVHSLILSLLRSRTSDEVRFVFIDPKGCELKAYKSLSSKHILTASDTPNEKVITTPARAETLLRELCDELESRRETLASERAANIRELQASGKAMPHIVVIIDEFADLTAPTWIDRKTDKLPDEIMKHIICLAQNGEPVGIHLVITTQRPSRKVITRAIKAHFPTRMAFRMLSSYESKLVIDNPGAEWLAGSGDMILAYDGEVCRIQGAYADREEMEDLLGTVGDPLFDAACHIAQKSGLSSVSLLQREGNFV